MENRERTMEQTTSRLLLHIADLLWEKGFISRDERFSIKKRIVREHGEKRS